MAARPTTGMRVGTGYKRMGTAARGTTGRLRTGAVNAGGVGGNAMAVPVALGARPMTMQGLGGTRPKTQGPGRQVMDESYFLGLLRAKIAELTAEITRLTKEAEQHERDHSSYTSYEKKAEGLASEIKQLQADLADLNMLADNLNTNTDPREVLAERDDLKAHNDREASEIDDIFSERSQIDKRIKEVEEEIRKERGAVDAVVSDMTRDQREAYQEMQARSATLAKDIEEKQTKLESLTQETDSLQRELDSNPVKRQAVSLLDQLKALNDKHEALKSDIEKEEATSPEQLRENLLVQVKADNQEIAAMERKITEVQARIKELSTEMEDMDNEDDEEDDEKRQKYLQLVKHEKEMEVFMADYEETYREEEERVKAHESRVVELLEAISRSLEHAQNLPSQQDHQSLKSDLAFKTREMKNSKATAQALEAQREARAQELKKVDTLEEKIEAELKGLKEEMDRMRTELPKYKDLAGLQERMKTNKQELAQERQRLLKRREFMKKMMQDMAARHDKFKTQLQENDTHIQLSNLLKKWQHYEKNNYVVRDFIASKEKEADYGAVSQRVTSLIAEHNAQVSSEWSSRRS